MPGTEMKRTRRMVSALFLLGTLSVAAGCSSSKKKKETFTGATGSSISRVQDKGWDRKKREYDHSVRSEFDQKTFSAKSKVKDKTFKTDNFSGKHDYKGASAFKSKEYADAGKQSREAKEHFKDGAKTSKEASKDFATKNSKFDNQKLHGADKSFADANDTYKTGEVRDAAKSQKKNTKPKILPKEDAMGKSVYTEDDVKRLLNRN